MKNGIDSEDIDSGLYDLIHRRKCQNRCMRAVTQRVTRAEVFVRGEIVGRIGPGLVVLVAIRDGDSEGDCDALAEKLVGLRIFRDDAGKMNRSILEIGGSMLLVSQFTLYGDVRRGRRPSFVEAADTELAESLFDRVVSCVRERGVAVETGRFGEMMMVELANDGPVTLVIEVEGGRVA